MLSIIFLIMGIFWILASLLGEGSNLLIAPGIMNLIVASLLLFKVQKILLRILLLPTALYNLIILIYQAYSIYILLTFNLTIFNLLSLIIYSIISISFLLISLIAYSKPQILIPQYPTFGESKNHKKQEPSKL